MEQGINALITKAHNYEQANFRCAIIVSGTVLILLESGQGEHLYSIVNFADNGPVTTPPVSYDYDGILTSKVNVNESHLSAQGQSSS